MQIGIALGKFDISKDVARTILFEAAKMVLPCSMDAAGDDEDERKDGHVSGDENATPPPPEPKVDPHTSEHCADRMPKFLFDKSVPNLCDCFFQDMNGAAIYVRAAPEVVSSKLDSRKQPAATSSFAQLLQDLDLPVKLCSTLPLDKKDPEGNAMAKSKRWLDSAVELDEAGRGGANSF